jgi:hypothetical protein
MKRNPLSLFMLGGIALTVGQGAHAKADDAAPGQEKVRAGALQTLIKPSSGAPQSATPRAVCTFASIGLYWTPDGGADDKTCRVRYRAIGEPAWREALPLWFDKRIGEYRGSIVQLPSGTTYDVRLELAGGGPSTELRAATWSETFPVARTVPVDDMTGKTLTVDQSGTAAGYVLYTHRAGVAVATIDAADQMDHCLEVKASHVIIRGLTLRSPKIHGIVLGKDAHDVVIERCDIAVRDKLRARRRASSTRAVPKSPDRGTDPTVRSPRLPDICGPAARLGWSPRHRRTAVVVAGGCCACLPSGKMPGNQSTCHC